MKNVVKVIGLVMILILVACQKEESLISNENSGTSLQAVILSTKKPLKAHVTKETPFKPRFGHTSVVFENKMWVIGGRAFESPSALNLNEVWNSNDGLQWTEMTKEEQFSGRFDHASTVFDNKIWVVGGRTSEYSDDSSELNDVWSSEDGIEWEQVTANASFSPRFFHTLTAFNGSLWIIGGRGGEGSNSWEVWRSFNGKDWFLVTDYPPFSWRRGHATAVFDGKLWLVGGWTNSGIVNDVWYSEDGYTWTEATSEAAFSERWNHRLTVQDGRMWLTAGTLLFDYYNDIWSSVDGVEWEQHKTTIMFPARQRHTALAYNDRLWVLNGLGIITWPSSDSFSPFIHKDVWSFDIPKN